MISFSQRPSAKIPLANAGGICYYNTGRGCQRTVASLDRKNYSVKRGRLMGRSNFFFNIPGKNQWLEKMIVQSQINPSHFSEWLAGF